jgi:hypothetical protein
LFVVFPSGSIPLLQGLFLGSDEMTVVSASWKSKFRLEPGQESSSTFLAIWHVIGRLYRNRLPDGDGDR